MALKLGCWHPLYANSPSTCALAANGKINSIIPSALNYLPYSPQVWASAYNYLANLYRDSGTSMAGPV